eukprot:TRINITY_DN6480_c0_g2_i1.p1 TRINITY_DN6480_c0_g2~~TRINITY_DN6480_c0_g2_i1.p1  ORF type:complete len:373 (-),score=49.11 TRINITY_DN6480_c0_g2_i1:44-1162(-)
MKRTRDQSFFGNSQSLVEACLDNRVDDLLSILQGNVDRCIEEFNFTLRWACENNQPEILRAVLKKRKVRADIDNNICVRLASEKGHAEVLKALLVNRHVNPRVMDSLPLRAACIRGHAEVVKILLEHGSLPDARDNEALIKACENGHTEVVRLLLRDKRVNPQAQYGSALYEAVTMGQVEVVELLMRDKRVLPGYERALEIAKSMEHIEIVKIIIYSTKRCVTEDNKTWMWACNNGHHGVMEALIECDKIPQLEVAEHGFLECCKLGDLEGVKYILGERRIIMRQNDLPLAVASSMGHEAVVRVLLQDYRFGRVSGVPGAIREAYASREWGVLSALLSNQKLNKDTPAMLLLLQAKNRLISSALQPDNQEKN